MNNHEDRLDAVQDLMSKTFDWKQIYRDFEKAAENLNRTKQAVSVYYYNYFRKNVNLFTMTTKSYKSKNVKNERKVNVESTDLVELVSTLMNKLTNNQKIEVIKNIKF